MAPPRIPLAERLRRHSVRRESGCLEWTGNVARVGYGELHIPLGAGVRRKVYAHRLAYELAKGPIPVGQCVCHACDNRVCIEPDHLWLGTRSDNTNDMHAKGRAYRPPSLTPCGTYAAASRHVRLGEPMDEWCLAALREYKRVWARKHYVPRGLIGVLVEDGHWPE